jgi:hypothetical protein
MSSASEMLSNEFNQIAMLSFAGLSTSMAMGFVGGFWVVFPWF